ncbi:MAG: hypothetical protein R8P61_00390 [Bacteroidia bacterium]|nr:hypothetical protein [Bacteroidia bacterium]
MKKFLFLFLFLPLIFSCREPEVIIQEVEVPREVDFEELEFSRGVFQRYFNMQRVGESILVQGEKRIAKINLSGDHDNCIFFWNDANKEAITEDFYLNSTERSLQFWSSKSGSICSDQLRTNLLNDSIEVGINPNPLYELKFLENYALISGQHVLYPYSTGADMQLKLALIEMDFTENTGIYARVFPGNIQKIEFPGVSILNYTFLQWSLEDGFIFSIGSNDPANYGTYKMGLDGNYQKISDQIFIRVFSYQERLYAMYDSFGQSFIIESPDGGQSWIQRFTADGITLAATSFYELEGELVGHWNGQLVLVEEFTESLFKTVELEPRELENDYITSMAKLGDKVYISTLSGLFSRDWQEFLADKK